MPSIDTCCGVSLETLPAPASNENGQYSDVTLQGKVRLKVRA